MSAIQLSGCEFEWFGLGWNYYSLIGVFECILINCPLDVVWEITSVEFKNKWAIFEQVSLKSEKMSDNNQIQAKWSRRKPFSRLIQVIDAQVAKTRETFQCGYCGRHSLTILISKSFKLSLVIPLTVYHTEFGRICSWWTNNVWLLFFSLFSFLFLLILYRYLRRNYVLVTSQQK